MKKKFLLFVFAFGLLTQIANAQLIKGDINDDGVLDISDINGVIATMLEKSDIQYINTGGDPYMVDNARVAGTWYKTKSEHFTLNDDGTTNYSGAATFKFLPYQGRILFFDNNGKLLTWMDVIMLEDGCLSVVPFKTGVLTILSNTQPIQLVTSISLSADHLEMKPNEFVQLTATVLPEDADNKTVVWESSNESVVRLMGDIILAVGGGTATVTCSATDGSGIVAECKVQVEHEYVDLGLPGGVLWATCNIGASKPEEFGKYFAWGDTVGYAKGEKHNFNWSTYKWCNGSSTTMTKYCTDSTYGTIDNKTVLDPEDDAATANWGANWRLPTRQEIEDLCNSDYTTSEWITINGVKGREITSKSNGNSIFLPAAGYYSNSTLTLEGFHGDYLSSSLSDYNANIYALFLSYNEFKTLNFGRNYGISVRAVRAK